MKRLRRAALGAYDKTANWGWLYNPPPYDFLDTAGQTMPNGNFYAPSASMGLGCGNNSSCSKCSGGLGLFDGGLDFQSWTWLEFATVAAGLYLAASVFGDGRNVYLQAGKVRRAFR